MRGTPLASDGEFIYALAAYRTDTESSTMKRIVCEVYDLDEKTLTRVAEIVLLKQNGDPYRGSTRNFQNEGGFLNHVNLACNGTVIVLNTQCKLHVFNMESGIRIKTHSLSKQMRWFCPKKNVFFFGDTHSSYSYLRHNTLVGFKQKTVIAKKRKLPKPPIVLDQIKGEILTAIQEIPALEKTPMNLHQRLILDSFDSNLSENSTSEEEKPALQNFKFDSGL